MTNRKSRIWTLMLSSALLAGAGLVLISADAGAEAKKGRYVSKSALKRACERAGSSFMDWSKLGAGNWYTCFTEGKHDVACDGDKKTCLISHCETDPNIECSSKTNVARPGSAIRRTVLGAGKTSMARARMGVGGSNGILESPPASTKKQVEARRDARATAAKKAARKDAAKSANTAASKPATKAIADPKLVDPGLFGRKCIGTQCLHCDENGRNCGWETIIERRRGGLR